MHEPLRARALAATVGARWGARWGARCGERGRLEAAAAPARRSILRCLPSKSAPLVATARATLLASAKTTYALYESRICRSSACVITAAFLGRLGSAAAAERIRTESTAPNCACEVRWAA